MILILLFTLLIVFLGKQNRNDIHHFIWLWQVNCWKHNPLFGWDLSRAPNKMEVCVFPSLLDSIKQSMFRITLELVWQRNSFVWCRSEMFIHDGYSIRRKHLVKCVVGGDYVITLHSGQNCILPTLLCGNSFTWVEDWID